MTLAATVAKRSTWHCEDKKITKNGENDQFSNHCFSGEKFPQ
jgi:hypothetical protein